MSSSRVSHRVTPAWRKSAETAASEPARAAVWDEAAREPAPVTPLFIARIGLVRATRRAMRPKRLRIPERLEVEQDDGRCRVVLPVLEQVVRRDVCLVPDRDEGREPEASALRLGEEGETERPALR